MSHSTYIWLAFMVLAFLAGMATQYLMGIHNG